MLRWKLALVCAAHLSTGLLMCGISMRLSPAAGARAALAPHRLPLLLLFLLHPPPPLLCLLSVLPCVCACVCPVWMYGLSSPGGEEFQ